MKKDEISNPKKNAGVFAAQDIADNTFLGLGTGSTAFYFIEEIGRRLKEGSLKNIKAVSSSFSTSILAQEKGIPILQMDQVSEIDIYVDGADEVDPQGHLIKGRGGAMVREKIIAASAAQFWVIVDESKLVPHLGTNFPVPIEVLPFAYKVVEKRITQLGVTPTLRQAVSKDGPVVTDQGNFILDATFSTQQDFTKLSTIIKQIPGVLDHGIFIHLASKLIIGKEEGTESRTLR